MRAEIETYSTDDSIVMQAKGARNLWAEYHSDDRYWYLEVDGFWYETASDQAVYRFFAEVLSGEPALKALKSVFPKFKADPEPVRCRCCNSIISYLPQ